MQAGRKETGRQARRQAAGAGEQEGDLGYIVRAIAGRGRRVRAATDLLYGRITQGLPYR